MKYLHRKLRIALSVFVANLVVWGGCLGNLTAQDSAASNGVFLNVLGTVQDGGAPHLGCQRPCCRNLFLRPALDLKVVSLGIVDYSNERTILFEATPDFVSQTAELQRRSGLKRLVPNAIFLTHAHMGHYTGLMHLGREALGAKGVPVYAMPRMRQFLAENGPWSQLVELENIVLNPLVAEAPVEVSPDVRVTPILVPHRDEFSETVGYRIEGPNRSVLFIPDINKWEQWDRDLIQVLAGVDRAYLDATFYDSSEVGHRDMSEIPHPFMVETITILAHLPLSEREKVHFIHLNHTNPCLDNSSPAFREVREQGFQVAQVGDAYEL